MKIRRVTENDCEKVYAMINELENLSLDKDKFSKIFLENFKDSNIHYSIAEKEGCIVGFVSLHIQKLLHHASKVAEIQELFVDSSLRGEGVGEKLVGHARDIAMREGCTLLEAASSFKRERTHRFYERRTGMKKIHYKFTVDL